MELQLMDDFVMPENIARTGRGSAFFTEDTQKLMERMTVGQGFILPTIATRGRKMDTPAGLEECCKILFTNFPWYAKKHFAGTGKEFTFGRMADNKGVACRCTKLSDAQVAALAADAPKEGE